jgi:glycosyltransferase involved in cell wall biosynthesis
MKLTVSIITYQQVGYIRQALDSVLRQRTAFPFEIVVSDDGSTDGTRAVLAEIAARHPGRIRLLLPEKNYGDRGLSNMLASIDAARGEYIAMLDGDDYWTDPDKLQRQVDFLDAHPECAICAHRVEHLSDDAHRQLSTPPAGGGGVHDVGKLLVENFAPRISTMVRRSAVDALPEWYRTTRVVSADWLFNVLTGRTGKVGFIDEVMAVHRKHSGSVSAVAGARRMLADKLAVLAALRPYFPEHERELTRSARRLRWKLRVARLGPGPYLFFQRLYAGARSK